MLDQLTDRDSELGSVRHLTQEDLEAYAAGRLAAARSSSCQTHLESCEACRAELEDLRAFKGELAGFSRPAPKGREIARGKRSRGLSLPLSASVAAVIVAVASIVLWMRHEKPRTSKSPMAMAAPPPPAAPPAASTQTDVTRAAPAVHAVALSPAPDADRPRGSASPSPAAPDASKAFALLGPLGKTISETRPEFSWQPLPGAIRYSVAIVDERLHPVQRSRALRTTVWRPRRPLRRGRTYLWQVTATLRGGSKVVASEPGMLTESAAELVQAAPANPGDQPPPGPAETSERAARHRT